MKGQDITHKCFDDETPLYKMLKENNLLIPLWILIGGYLLSNLILAIILIYYSFVGN